MITGMWTDQEPDKEDPDLVEAKNELDTEFPGADFDESLYKYKIFHDKRKSIVKNFIIHGFIYFVFTLVFYFILRKYDLSIFGYMTYGLSYFVFYFAITLKR